MNPLLQLEGVSLRYQTAEAETVAIERLDLSVAPGEFVAIVGPSGCGKSTVLSMIAGLLPPTAGSITLTARPLTALCPASATCCKRDYLFEWRSIWGKRRAGAGRKEAARRQGTRGIAFEDLRALRI